MPAFVEEIDTSYKSDGITVFVSLSVTTTVGWVLLSLYVAFPEITTDKLFLLGVAGLIVYSPPLIVPA